MHQQLILSTSDSLNAFATVTYLLPITNLDLMLWIDGPFTDNRRFPAACRVALSTMSTWFDFDTYRVGCLWASSPHMLMFLLADLSSMKPNCLSQRRTVEFVEPLKSSRPMLMRCPEGASNDQGRSRLPHTMLWPSVLLFSDDGNRNFCSLFTSTWHERSGWTTARIISASFQSCKPRNQIFNLPLINRLTDMQL